MLNLSFLNELLLLILSLLLLNLKVHVDLIFLRNIDISKLKLLNIEIMPPQMTLFTFEHYGIVFIVSKLISKFYHINPSSDNGSLINRALRAREEICILLTDVGV